MTELQEVLRKMDIALCRIPVAGPAAIYMGEALCLLLRAQKLAEKEKAGVKDE